VDAALPNERSGKLVNETLTPRASQAPSGAAGAIGLYLGYRKPKRKDDNREEKKEAVSELSTLGFCQLPGVARVGVIRAEGSLKVLDGRAKCGVSFLGLALGLQGTS
jgi:hypothetical protein